MLDFFVYILKCSDSSYYIGHTDDIEKRISEHKNKKHSGYTATRLPVELVFHQGFPTRDEAFKAERKIKGWNRRKKEALIANDWKTLINLSNHNKNMCSTRILRQAQDERRKS